MDRDILEDGTYRHLGTRALIIMILQHTLPALVILFLSLFLTIFSPFIGWLLAVVTKIQVAVDRTDVVGGAFRNLGFAGIGIFIIAFSIGFLIAWLKYSCYRYILRDSAIEIEQGIFYKDAVSIPYRSIQNVDIKRSISFRIFGVSRVLILTAGHEDFNMVAGESEGIIPIMDKDQAENLREVLLGRTHVQEVRHSADSGLNY